MSKLAQQEATVENFRDDFEEAYYYNNHRDMRIALQRMRDFGFEEDADYLLTTLPPAIRSRMVEIEWDEQ